MYNKQNSKIEKELINYYKITYTVKVYRNQTRRNMNL